MDLSIIIPSFNTKDLLDRCLSSIYSSTGNKKFSFEVIVVDNASDDGTKALLNKKYPRVVKIFNRENLGFGKANNQGIQKAKGKYILLLNSDIKVIDGAIENLWRFATSQENIFAGGKLINENGSPQASAGPFYTLPVVFTMLFCKGDQLGITRSSPEQIQEVDWVSGACLMGQKSSFIDVGLFDEEIFMYMEEIEFLFRAKKKGYKTFCCPDARFIHSGAGSSGNQRTPIVNIYRGLLYFFRKHRSVFAYIIVQYMLKAKALAAIVLGRIMGRKELYTLYEEAFRLV